MIARADTVDLQKLYRREYAASANPAFVNIGKAFYLSAAGQGAPGSELFQRRIEALYSVAFTVKMASKFAGRNYTVSKLEGLWWAADPSRRFIEQNKALWEWRLLVRVPDFIRAADVAAAAQALRRKGDAIDAEAIQLEELREGRCIQCLHVGPYSTEAPTLQAMEDYCRERGYVLCGRHHEVYLSDPRRTPASRIRTIIRQPVILTE